MFGTHKTHLSNHMEAVGALILMWCLEIMCRAPMLMQFSSVLKSYGVWAGIAWPVDLSIIPSDPSITIQNYPITMTLSSSTCIVSSPYCYGGGAFLGSINKVENINLSFTMLLFGKNVSMESVVLLRLAVWSAQMKQSRWTVAAELTPRLKALHSSYQKASTASKCEKISEPSMHPLVGVVSSACIRLSPLLPLQLTHI